MSFFNETFSSNSISNSSLPNLTQPLNNDLLLEKGHLQSIAVTPDSLAQVTQGLQTSALTQTIDSSYSITHEQSFLPIVQNLDGALTSSNLDRDATASGTDHATNTRVSGDHLIRQVGVFTEAIDQSARDILLHGNARGPGDETTFSNLITMGPAQTDAAGNTLATAHNMGTLAGNQTFQDFVGTADSDDYYRFSLIQGSTLNLALTGLSADANVQLLNSDGKIITGSYGAARSSEAITQALNAGDYYIRVYQFDGNTNYQLTVSTNATPSQDGAGNTLDTARNIGTLDNSQSFTDFVGTGDTNDYYRFSLDQNSNFRLELTDLSADADVQLLNSSGQVIDRSFGSGTSSELINRVLAAGTYYARVYPFDTANTNYQLTLSATENTTPPSFSNVYGYGLVNAATAVARAAGQTSPFPNVADLGGNSWGLDMVNAPEAWARGYTGDGVVVAVIDSGVDINHADLQGNIWRNSGEIANNGIDDDGNGYIDDVNGWNFGSGQNNNNVLPGTNERGQGHGTHVAGTIAAANNGIGMTGVAHDAQIMAIRMGDVAGGRFTNPGSLADAIRYAVNNGADVINMSLGWTDSPELQSALAYAASNNVITVSAAGNGDRSGNGLPSPGNPAQYATQYGISVGAVDINQDIARFSNRAGSNSALQHVTAPGVSVYSTQPNDTYGFSSGTSMAAPHVAGVIALMLDANPNLTHAQVRQILTDSSVNLS